MVPFLRNAVRYIHTSISIKFQGLWTHKNPSIDTQVSKPQSRGECRRKISFKNSKKRKKQLKIEIYSRSKEEKVMCLLIWNKFTLI